MKEISLEMVRDQMDHLPSFSYPSDYTIRTFVRGDERLWAKIETLAGEFPNQEQASEHFKAEFGSFLSEMEDRCFLLEDRHGEAIGTATAWYGHFEGEERGGVTLTRFCGAGECGKSLDVLLIHDRTDIP